MKSKLRMIFAAVAVALMLVCAFAPLVSNGNSVSAESSIEEAKNVNEEVSAESIITELLTSLITREGSGDSLATSLASLFSNSSSDDGSVEYTAEMSSSSVIEQSYSQVSVEEKKTIRQRDILYIPVENTVDYSKVTQLTTAGVEKGAVAGMFGNGTVNLIGSEANQSSIIIKNGGTLVLFPTASGDYSFNFTYAQGEGDQYGNICVESGAILNIFGISFKIIFDSEKDTVMASLFSLKDGCTMQLGRSHAAVDSYIDVINVTGAGDNKLGIAGLFDNSAVSPMTSASDAVFTLKYDLISDWRVDDDKTAKLSVGNISLTSSVTSIRSDEKSHNFTFSLKTDKLDVAMYEPASGSDLRDVEAKITGETGEGKVSGIELSYANEVALSSFTSIYNLKSNGGFTVNRFSDLEESYCTTSFKVTIENEVTIDSVTVAGAVFSNVKLNVNKYSESDGKIVLVTMGLHDNYANTGVIICGNIRATADSALVVIPGSSASLMVYISEPTLELSGFVHLVNVSSTEGPYTIEGVAFDIEDATLKISGKKVGITVLGVGEIGTIESFAVGVECTATATPLDMMNMGAIVTLDIDLKNVDIKDLDGKTQMIKASSIVVDNLNVKFILGDPSGDGEPATENPKFTLSVSAKKIAIEAEEMNIPGYIKAEKLKIDAESISINAKGVQRTDGKGGNIPGVSLPIELSLLDAKADATVKADYLLIPEKVLMEKAVITVEGVSVNVDMNATTETDVGTICAVGNISAESETVVIYENGAPALTIIGLKAAINAEKFNVNIEKQVVQQSVSYYYTFVVDGSVEIGVKSVTGIYRDTTVNIFGDPEVEEKEYASVSLYPDNFIATYGVSSAGSRGFVQFIGKIELTAVADSVIIQNKTAGISFSAEKMDVTIGLNIKYSAIDKEFSIGFDVTGGLQNLNVGGTVVSKISVDALKVSAALDNESGSSMTIKVAAKEISVSGTLMTEVAYLQKVSLKAMDLDLSIVLTLVTKINPNESVAGESSTSVDYEFQSAEIKKGKVEVSSKNIMLNWGKAYRCTIDEFKTSLSLNDTAITAQKQTYGEEVVTYYSFDINGSAYIGADTVSGRYGGIRFNFAGDVVEEKSIPAKIELVLNELKGIYRSDSTGSGGFTEISADAVLKMYAKSAVIDDRDKAFCIDAEDVNLNFGLDHLYSSSKNVFMIGLDVSGSMNNPKISMIDGTFTNVSIDELKATVSTDLAGKGDLDVGISAREISVSGSMNVPGAVSLDTATMKVSDLNVTSALVLKPNDISDPSRGISVEFKSVDITDGDFLLDAKTIHIYDGSTGDLSIDTLSALVSIQKVSLSVENDVSVSGKYYTVAVDGSIGFTANSITGTFKGIGIKFIGDSVKGVPAGVAITMDIPTAILSVDSSGIVGLTKFDGRADVTVTAVVISVEDKSIGTEISTYDVDLTLNHICQYAPSEKVFMIGFGVNGTIYDQTIDGLSVVMSLDRDTGEMKIDVELNDLAASGPLNFPGTVSCDNLSVDIKDLNMSLVLALKPKAVAAVSNDLQIPFDVEFKLLDVKSGDISFKAKTLYLYDGGTGTLTFTELDALVSVSKFTFALQESAIAGETSYTFEADGSVGFMADAVIGDYKGISINFIGGEEIPASAAATLNEVKGVLRVPSGGSPGLMKFSGSVDLTVIADVLIIGVKGQSMTFNTEKVNITLGLSHEYDPSQKLFSIVLTADGRMEPVAVDGLRVSMSVDYGTGDLLIGVTVKELTAGGPMNIGSSVKCEKLDVDIKNLDMSLILALKPKAAAAVSNDIPITFDVEFKSVSVNSVDLQIGADHLYIYEGGSIGYTIHGVKASASVNKFIMTSEKKVYDQVTDTCYNFEADGSVSVGVNIMTGTYRGISVNIFGGVEGGKAIPASVSLSLKDTKGVCRVSESGSFGFTEISGSATLGIVAKIVSIDVDAAGLGFAAEKVDMTADIEHTYSSSKNVFSIGFGVNGGMEKLEVGDIALENISVKDLMLSASIDLTSSTGKVDIIVKAKDIMVNGSMFIAGAVTLDTAKAEISDLDSVFTVKLIPKISATAGDTKVSFDVEPISLDVFGGELALSVKELMIFINDSASNSVPQLSMIELEQASAVFTFSDSFLVFYNEAGKTEVIQTQLKADVAGSAKKVEVPGMLLTDLEYDLDYLSFIEGDESQTAGEYEAGVGKAKLAANVGDPNYPNNTKLYAVFEARNMDVRAEGTDLELFRGESISLNAKIRYDGLDRTSSLSVSEIIVYPVDKSVSFESLSLDCNFPAKVLQGLNVDIVGQLEAKKVAAKSNSGAIDIKGDYLRVLYGSTIADASCLDRISVTFADGFTYDGKKNGITAPSVKGYLKNLGEDEQPFSIVTNGNDVPTVLFAKNMVIFDKGTVAFEGGYMPLRVTVNKGVDFSANGLSAPCFFFSSEATLSGTVTMDTSVSKYDYRIISLDNKQIVSISGVGTDSLVKSGYVLTMDIGPLNSGTLTAKNGLEIPEWKSEYGTKYVRSNDHKTATFDVGTGASFSFNCVPLEYQFSYEGGKSVAKAYGSVFEITQNGPAKEGLLFFGWNDGTGTTYQVGSKYIMPARDVILTPVYVDNAPQVKTEGTGADTSKIVETDKTSNATVSSATLNQIGANGSLVIKVSGAQIKMDKNTVKGLMDEVYSDEWALYFSVTKATEYNTELMKNIVKDGMLYSIGLYSVNLNTKQSEKFDYTEGEKFLVTINVKVDGKVSDIGVSYINAEGTTRAVGIVDKVDKGDGTYDVTFECNHFSNYVITPVYTVEETHDYVPLAIGLAIVAILALLVAVIARKH